MSFHAQSRNSAELIGIDRDRGAAIVDEKRVGDRTRTGDNQIHSLEPTQPNSLSGNSSEDAQKRLDRALTKETVASSEINPDLALIIDAWPQLPEAIRRAIMALIMIHPDLGQQTAKSSLAPPSADGAASAK